MLRQVPTTEPLRSRRMSHLRLVDAPPPVQVPVRLLLAVTGRCSCEDCCRRYRADPRLGRLSPDPDLLTAVR